MPITHRLLAEAQAIADGQAPFPFAKAKTIMGQQHRFAAGMGDDFWQYRPYSPPEPASRIDWRKTARLDTPLIRDKQQQGGNRLYIWLDDSEGMHWSSKPKTRTKYEQAALYVLVQAAIALKHQHFVAWQGSKALSARHLMAWWELVGAARIDTPSILPWAAKAHYTLLASDWLMDDRLDLLTALPQGQGTLIHAIDPQEQAFTYSGYWQMQGMTGVIKDIPEARHVREDYQARFTMHQMQLEQAASVAHWLYYPIKNPF
jgi:hypothetical protein